MLFLCLYVCAIVLTRMCARQYQHEGMDVPEERVEFGEEHFGTMAQSMFTLFALMSARRAGAGSERSGYPGLRHVLVGGSVLLWIVRDQSVEFGDAWGSHRSQLVVLLIRSSQKQVGSTSLHFVDIRAGSNSSSV